MSFTTPTVDVYLPGTTLGIGNVNAGTINIGKTTTQINVGGPTTFTNSVAVPSCTMASLTTGNLIISPYSENVRFSNLSATNATVTNMSATNASFQRFNSSNILIGPYPQNGTFDTINVTNPTITNLNSTNLNSTNINALNASSNVLNVSNFLITPLNSNPTFVSVGSTTMNTTNVNTTNLISTNINTTNMSIVNASITTMSVTTPITIRYTAAPTLSSQIGWNTTITTVASPSTISNGTYYTLCTVPTISIGTYIFSYTYCPTISNTCTASLMIGVFLGTSVTTSTAPTLGVTTVNNGTYSTGAYATNVNGCGAIINNSASNNVYLQFTVMGGSAAANWSTTPSTNNSNSGLYFTLTRIA